MPGGFYCTSDFGIYAGASTAIVSDLPPFGPMPAGVPIRKTRDSRNTAATATASSSMSDLDGGASDGQKNGSRMSNQRCLDARNAIGVNKGGDGAGH
ncbi:hypothetical protein [Actinoplanes sp. NPDC026619]|uniref:hypothetical protein n=1 Tax=Actinoplanes sp. NPDC026619 TaxID=3155798 RepID=UPI0033EA0820